MDKSRQDNNSEQSPQQPPPIPKKANSILTGNVMDATAWRIFFNVAGASVFYCLSAVFIASGIIKVLGPILSESNSLRDALPCILTLHLYEIALIGVFILIVFKKAVDDAISLMFLMALFLVGTSIAIGSVADTAIKASLYAGGIGVILSVVKFYSMKKFAKIQFGFLSIVGLTILMMCNYFGPSFMAKIISTHASQRIVCREYWFVISILILVGAIFIIIEAVKKPREQDSKAAFLQTPIMAYIFALMILIASGVHQYAIGYIFALKYALGDFIPVIAACSILLFEILHHGGKRFKVLQAAVLCIPFALTLIAILNKAVLASGEMNASLISYPPVILALSGLVIAILAIYHRWNQLLILTFIYVLGVVLTAGFSPQNPYDLNIQALLATCTISLFVYGLVVWGQYYCLAGVISFCFLLPYIQGFAKFVSNNNLTQEGALVGVFGFGSMILYLIFGRSLNKAVRIVGTIFFAIFLFDYLPAQIAWSYLWTLIVTGLILISIWVRTKDALLIPILLLPFFFRLYILLKFIGHWRQVIAGFLLLGVGMTISLWKNSIKKLPK